MPNAFTVYISQNFARAVKPLHWMLIGIVVWLSLAALGLRWVLGPYWWFTRPTLGGEGRSLNEARHDFLIHIASFTTSKTPVPAPANEEEFEAGDPILMNWVWRETLARFVVGFALWMFSGWFVHWFTGRIVHGRRRFARTRAQ